MSAFTLSGRIAREASPLSVPDALDRMACDEDTHGHPVCIQPGIDYLPVAH